jgi:hypothetical protein
MLPTQIQQKMSGRLRYEIKKLRGVRARLCELQDQYNEIQDLQNEADRREARSRILIGLIGAVELKSEGPDSVLSDLRESRTRPPVWKAMREYLRHAGEARIVDFERFFSLINLEDANRNSIESALKQHPRIFETEKRKREKFIFLKKR